MIYYPYCVTKNGRHIPENYEWFVGNKQIAGIGKGTNHVICESLPPILTKEEITRKVVLGSQMPYLSLIEKEGRMYSLRFDSSTSASSPLPHLSRPKVKEKSEVEKLTETLKQEKLKNVHKILGQLKAQKLKEVDIIAIGHALNKRPDSKNKLNPQVQKYFAVFKELKGRQ